ncbi:S-locus glycoprotein [Corchorus olitorius]|uniref:S-locus glycoprotein n=1 Tax=Corchorus olitorius TaxID=93759 RepID=A0A1R3J4A2_9ROSI|nr:S-locus glycoprotein [Corchorus olitorius]
MGIDILSLVFTTFFLTIIFSKVSNALDMISPSDSLTDGMTLVSNDGSFELGFFTQGSSKNRMTPITDSTGLLKTETTGKVVLQAQNRTTVWSVNSTGGVGVRNPTLQLLNSGNLVVKDDIGDSENYWWQSFDYLTDTLLPGMKFGWDLRIGLSRRLAAWKNADDPSPGDLTYGIELQGNLEMVIQKGSVKYVRSGLWNGEGFTGSIYFRNNPFYTYDFIWNEEEVYYINFLKNKSVMSSVVLEQTGGERRRYTWNPETQAWQMYSVHPNNNCDTYGRCGPNGTYKGENEDLELEVFELGTISRATDGFSSNNKLGQGGDTSK